MSAGQEQCPCCGAEVVYDLGSFSCEQHRVRYKTRWRCVCGAMGFDEFAMDERCLLNDITGELEDIPIQIGGEVNVDQVQQVHPLAGQSV